MSLGLLFLKRTDRQGWFRYIVMIIAVALSAAALMASLAFGAGVAGQNRRGIWVGQIAYNMQDFGVENLSADQSKLKNKTLMSFRSTYFNGESGKKNLISELGLKQMGPKSPKMPEISKMPKRNELLVSKAMMELMEKEPALRRRYQKYDVKLGIPDSLLSSPDTKMVAYEIPEGWFHKYEAGNKLRDGVVAFGKKDLPKFTAPSETRSTMITETFMLVFGLGLCFPMMVLLIIATRIGMVQREQRYAALSLIGASKRQVNRIILAESLLSTGIGIIIGSGLYLVLKIWLLANLRFGGNRLFLEDMELSLGAYGGVVGLILLIVILVNLVALRKVKSSPLGVVKTQKMPKRPKIWSLAPLAVAAFSTYKLNQMGGAWFFKNSDMGMLWFAGTFLLTMASLLFAGGYLTYVVSRLISRVSRGAPGMMVSKRMRIFAKTIFSSVSGVVLALYVSSFFMTTLASVEKTFTAQYKEEQVMIDLQGMLRNERTVEVDLSSPESKQIFMREVEKNPELRKLLKGQYEKKFLIYKTQEKAGTSGELYTCKDLKQLTKLSCPAEFSEDEKVTVSADYAENKHIINKVASEAKFEVADNGVLFVFEDREKAEQGRELLRDTATMIARETGIAFTVSNPTETIWDLFTRIAGLIQVVLLGTTVTIIIAGFSVTVAAIGGVFERKRSFSNLRLSGVEVRQLGLVVILEMIIPMLLSAVVAVVAGMLTSKYLAAVTVGVKFVFATPHMEYLGMVAGALLGAIVIMVATLPILKQVTDLDQNRTE